MTRYELVKELNLLLNQLDNNNYKYIGNRLYELRVAFASKTIASLKSEGYIPRYSAKRLPASDLVARVVNALVNAEMNCQPGVKVGLIYQAITNARASLDTGRATLVEDMASSGKA
ncbi:TPA: hypothetical protein NKV59_002911 [Vibrio parahaemolyticus]|nr:hypothetical protein [Vibrio parahaemolyticus]